MAKCINVNLEPEDTDITHRMQKGNSRPRPIIVRFTNYYIRDKLHRGRTKLRRATCNVGNFINGANRVLINENLTALRSENYLKRLETKRKTTTTGERPVRKFAA